MPAHAIERLPLLPIPLNAYREAADANLGDVLVGRIASVPFNLAALLIFLLAIGHTFLTAKFRNLAHVVEEEHAREMRSGARAAADSDEDGLPDEVSFKGQVLHFLGEAEAVFGIWAVVLAGTIVYFFGWPAVVEYIGHKVNFTEPLFVVVIMALAGTRPILRCAERGLRVVASLGRGTTGAWWLSILIVVPVLGSFITEPAAMTIAALLLARQFYALKPSPRFAYATLGLLFVNTSVGGTPPILSRRRC